MITLEQVRALEARVEKAVAAIDQLVSENAALKDALSREKARAEGLEKTVEEFRRDQERVEEGILRALERLNVFEDAILGEVPPAAAPKAEGAAAPRSSTTGASAQGQPPAASRPTPSHVAAGKPAAPESASSITDGATPEPENGEAELEIF